MIGGRPHFDGCRVTAAWRIQRIHPLAVHRQIEDHLAHVLIAFIARLGEPALDDANELGRKRGVDLLQRLRDFLEDLVERCREGLRLERAASAQQLVQNHRRRKDVCAMIDTLPTDLFGRHVVDGAHHHVAARQLRRDEAGQAEVEDFDRAAVGDVNVCRLDVAMDDAVLVGVVEPLADFRRDLDLAPQAYSLRSRHPREEILSLQVLHGEIRLSLVLAEIVNGNDVSVRQLAGGSRLAEEPFAQLRVLIDRDRNHLDGDDPFEERVAGAIHDPHATLAEFFDDLIPADTLHVERAPPAARAERRGVLNGG